MRKAQALVISAVILLVVFGLIISLFVIQWQQLTTKGDNFKELQEESVNVGMLLTTEPNPRSWNPDTLQKTGLVQGNELKSEYLIQYPLINYMQSKKLLGLKHDYLFFVENSSGSPIIINGYQYWGWNGRTFGNGGVNVSEAVDIITSNSKIIAKDERFVEFKMDPSNRAKIVTYVWEFVNGSVQATTSVDSYFRAGLQTEKPEYYVNDEVRLTFDPRIVR